jgi:CHAD domain-containing protein
MIAWKGATIRHWTSGSLMQESNEPLTSILDRKLREAATQLDRCDADLRRRCDADSVHALRVAVRRTRALLWSMKPWIRRRHYREVGGQLRAIGRQIGPLRDLDVLADKALAQTAARAGLAGDEYRQVRGVVLRRRLRSRSTVRKWVVSPAFRRMMQEVDGLLTRGPTLFRKSVPAAVNRWRKRILRGISGFDRQAHKAQRPDLHRMRILVKRCRYSLEVLGKAGSGKARRRLRDLQNSLGRYCDARLVAAWLMSPGAVRSRVVRRRLVQAARLQKNQYAQIALDALHAGM